MKNLEVQILIGDWDAFEAVIVAYLRREFQGQYNIFYQSSFRGEELEEIAKTRKFDLCIIIYNNVFWHEYAGLDRLDETVRFAARLKDLYDMPIIGLTGWGDPAHVEAAKQVSDFFFMLPPRLVELKEAFSKCLGGDK
jgi:hypothetical protein